MSKNQTYLIKFFAIFLITNYHFAPLYPEKIRVLSTGGALGLCLFFFISGFGNYYSILKSESFVKWITTKFIKLYVPLVMLTLVSLLVSKVSNGATRAVNLLLPVNLYLNTAYWFVGAIFVYYIILYYIIL